VLDVDAQRAERRMRLIGDVLAIATGLGVPVWLRGGWAMDFFLGQVTRDHVDIDWFAWLADAPVLDAALAHSGYRTIGHAPAEPHREEATLGRSGVDVGPARSTLGYD
jgi:hypothetical protein